MKMRHYFSVSDTLWNGTFLFFDDPPPPLFGPGPKFPHFLVWKASLNPVTLSNYIIPLLILQIENEKEKSHKQVFVPAYIQEVSQFA